MLDLGQALRPNAHQKRQPTISSENIPLVNVNSQHEHTVAPRIDRPKWYHGHHFGFRCCFFLVALVLLINVLLTIIVTSKQEAIDGIATFRQGDCTVTGRLDFSFHLLINILSTALLGASNYCMQCVSAPTRCDIDEAHSHHTWMDIGVPSVRNIKWISWPRKALWCLLCISSVPLHLIYNSVIFSGTSVAEFNMFVVTQTFSEDWKPGNMTALRKTVDSDAVHELTQMHDSMNSLEEMNSKDCRNTFGQLYTSTWSDVLVISTFSDANGSFLDIQGEQDEFGTSPPFFCDDARISVCDEAEIAAAGDKCIWLGSTHIVDRHCFPIDYCLARKAQQHCSLKFSVPIMVTVIIFNVVKLLCIAVLVWWMDSAPLVTLGDAVANFLDNPDPTTADNCLASKECFTKASTWAALPSRYHYQRRRWFASASRTRWLTNIALCVLTLIAASVLLSIAINSDGLRKGFGLVLASPTVFIKPSISTLDMVLLVNTPQLLLSFLYFAYNSLYTCMLLTLEWASFAHTRKPLRVTNPCGSQRSTYRLQLPYRYGIPLLITSALLHWLVSQYFFVIIVEKYRNNGTFDGYAEKSCGYSSSALLTTVVVGSSVLCIGIANGCRTYKSGIPLAGSCSAAISAACHPPPGDELPSRKAVKWGACGRSWKAEGEEPEVGVGHCGITSLAAERPVEGALYAGLATLASKELRGLDS